MFTRSANTKKYCTILDGKGTLRNNKCIQLFLENVTQFITTCVTLVVTHSKMLKNKIVHLNKDVAYDNGIDFATTINV